MDNSFMSYWKTRKKIRGEREQFHKEKNYRPSDIFHNGILMRIARRRGIIDISKEHLIIMGRNEAT